MNDHPDEPDTALSPSVLDPTCFDDVQVVEEVQGKHTPSEPGLLIYLIGIIIGSGVAYVIADRWLDITPGRVAIAVGAIAALYGVFSLANIGEAIVLTLVISLIVFGLLNIAPGLTIVKAGIVPSACGLSVGKLVVGLWKEAKT